MKTLVFMLIVVGFVLNCFALEIEITTATMDQVKPAVTSDGTNFVTIWEDSRAGSTNKNIYGIPIYADGEIPMVFFAISLERGNRTEPAIASDGDRFFMLWSEPDRDIKCRMSSFTALEAGPVELVSTTAQTSNIAVAFGGGGYFVVWQEADEIKCLAVSSSGTATSSAVTVSPASDNQTNPDVVYFNDRFLVVWEQRGGTAGIYGRYFNSDATPSGEAFAIDNVSSEPGAPAIAIGGGNAIVAYDVRVAGEKNVMGKVITATSVSDPFLISSGSGQEQNPTIAFGDGVFLVVYEDFGDSYFADIIARWVSPHGAALGEPFEISAQPAAQGDPSVAFAEETFLVAWEDRRLGGADIFGKILSAESFADGPVARTIYPPNNNKLSCEEIDIVVYLTAEDGINESTVSLIVDGSTYSLTDPELTLTADTLRLTGIDFPDDGIINCSVSGIEDLSGEVMGSDLVWSFIIDRTPPAFTAPVPPPESTRPNMPTMITVNIADEYSDLDVSSFAVEIHGIELSYPHTALSWNGVSLAVIVEHLGLEREYYTNRVCVTAADTPDHCDANTETFCWTFYNLSNVEENIPDNYQVHTAYPNPFNSACRIEIPNTAGKPAELRIYDIRGNLIDMQEAKSPAFIWQPDENVKSGTYKYIIRTDNYEAEGNVLYIK